MAGNRRILRPEFDLNKMLELPTSEARKYFITRFFLPVAYNLWESVSGATATLHIARIPTAKPSNKEPDQAAQLLPFIKILDLREDEVISDYLVGYDRIRNMAQYTRTVGYLIDIDNLAKAVAYAFGECFPDNATLPPAPTDVLHIKSTALIATIQYVTTDWFELRILTKLRDKVKSPAVLFDMSAARKAVVRLHRKHGRMFNSITGEWIGLCPDNSEQCSKCKEIRSSHVGLNAYDLPKPQ